MITIRRPVRYLLLITGIFLILYLYHPVGDYGFGSIGGHGKLSMVKSSTDWANVEPFHPPSSITPLPTGAPRPFPRIQHSFPPQSRADYSRQDKRRQAVKDVFRKSWGSYKKYAWMKDELTPVTAGSRNTFGGWAATLVDALDTMWIMDLKDDFYEAAGAALTLDWGNTTESSINMFETTIRHLGGLLAAYDQSGEQAILDKARELGDMLYVGFDTPNRMPGFWLDFARARNGQLLADDHEPSASPCTLSLEFTRLAQLTGESKYYDAVARITELLAKSQSTTKLPGMWPTFFDMRNLVLDNEVTFTLGALSDSLYEYLPKMNLLLGGLEPLYAKLFKGAAEPIIKYLLFRPMTPENAEIYFTGDATVSGEEVMLTPSSQHLSCFNGGMFALAGRQFENQEWLDIGTKLTRGCIYGYKAFSHGVLPEIFNVVDCKSLEGCEWDEKKWKAKRDKDNLPPGFVNAHDPRYILRPEALESVFLLYRVTGLKEFQDAAWEMFQSIQKLTETPYGNSAVEDVTVSGEPRKKNEMESFWLAETLKYLYLTFSPPDLISLDEYVFNTEAHPFKRPR